jgi:hypothetical protein
LPQPRQPETDDALEIASTQISIVAVFFRNILVLLMLLLLMMQVDVRNIFFVA